MSRRRGQSSRKSNKRRRRSRSRRNKNSGRRTKKRRRKRRRKSRRSNKSRSRKNRRSRRDKRSADPNMMNVERNQPPHDEYLIGDGTPSQFGEDVHEGPYQDTADNEIGMPEHSDWHGDHKGLDRWDSNKPYDNQGRDQGRTSRERMAQLEKKYEKKAMKCIRIAKELFAGDVTEAVLEEQALDLMSLPDESVTATLARVAEDEDMEEEEKEEEEKEEEESDKESNTNTNNDDEVLSTLQNVMGGQEQMQQQTQAVQQNAGHNQEMETLQDVVSNDGEMREAKMAQQIQETAVPGGGSTNHSNQDNLDVDMTTAYAPDTVQPEDMQGDEVVSSLLQDDGAAQQSKQSSKEGVQSVGRVKESSSQQGQGDKVNLSGLWEGKPDVSEVFNV